jgi:aryl-alcohol dehydrogenase-like predicted oxidoreductase
LYEDYGMGLTTWSPLASGQLTGKYLEKVPENSRAQISAMNSLREDIKNEKKRDAIKQFTGIAKDLSMQPGQLALLWCLSNPNVSSVILGASQNSQLLENLKALELKSKFTNEVKEKVSALFLGFETHS